MALPEMTWNAALRFAQLLLDPGLQSPKGVLIRHFGHQRVPNHRSVLTVFRKEDEVSCLCPAHGANPCSRELAELPMDSVLNREPQSRTTQVSWALCTGQ